MFDVDHLVQRLGNVSHFRGLPASALKDIVSAGSIRHYPKGKVIFIEGESCSGLFVLFHGRVHLCKISPQGQESIFGIIEPVIMFNEVAALDRGANPVTAVADQACITWRVGADELQQLMHRYPVVGLSLLPVMAHRNRMLLSYCEDVAFRSVTARTAKILLDISQHGQKIIDRRTHSNHVLAARAATVPEPLCRAIQSMRQEGFIKCTRTSISIQKPSELARLAEVECSFSD